MGPATVTRVGWWVSSGWVFLRGSRSPKKGSVFQNSLEQIRFPRSRSEFQMGQGRGAGGQSPAEPLSWEASHQVEEQVGILGEFALEKGLRLCETGH